MSESFFLYDIGKVAIFSFLGVQVTATFHRDGQTVFVSYTVYVT